MERNQRKIQQSKTITEQSSDTLVRPAHTANECVRGCASLLAIAVSVLSCVLLLAAFSLRASAAFAFAAAQASPGLEAEYAAAEWPDAVPVAPKPAAELDDCSAASPDDSAQAASRLDDRHPDDSVVNGLDSAAWPWDGHCAAHPVSDDLVVDDSVPTGLAQDDSPAGWARDADSEPADC